MLLCLGLYIEIVVFKVLGGFLDRSGWVNLFVKNNADIGSFGIVELFLNVSYFVKVGRVCEIIVVVLYVL